MAPVGSWVHDEGVQGSSEASDSPVAVRGSPVAMTTMKMTTRHTGTLRGSGGVVTVCAWVHVFPVAEARHWPTRSRRGAPWPTVRSGGRERPEEGKKFTVGGVED